MPNSGQRLSYIELRGKATSIKKIKFVQKQSGRTDFGGFDIFERT